ncbi:MAG: HAD family hydrolase [Acidimicrobiales bacterium]
MTAALRFDLVIFDNDGVLIDGERLAFGVLGTLLDDHGLPLPLDEPMERFLGGPLSRVVEWAAASGWPLPDDLVARYHDDLYSAFERGLAPTPGVVEVLDRVSTVAAICVASSGTRERIRRSLARVGLLNRFRGRIFSAADVTRGKPAPALFRHAAATMGVAADRCVVIEDSPLGIEAANAAGMASVGFSGSVPSEQLGGASLGVVSEMARLPARLGLPA